MASEALPSVLVTRPQGAAAQRLCATLSEAGYPVYYQPMLQLEAHESLSEGQQQLIDSLDAFQHIIFVSANAVEMAMAQILRRRQALPTTSTWYAVGEATASGLAEYGVHAKFPEQEMTSEGLLALDSLQSLQGQRVLIVKGEGGRQRLRETLTSRGAQVAELACYRRKPPPGLSSELRDLLAAGKIDVAVFSSAEGIVNFAQLLSPAESTTLSSLSVILPSQRVASKARELGFNKIIIAENASDAATLHALKARHYSPGEQ